jgi:predicted nucleic acid-binding protein
MAGIVFDTSIWIAYKPAKLPKSLIMSAVVLQELAAGAADRTVLKDTLIAVSVHRIHALLVTNNVKDFEAIQRYCRVRLTSGASFFGE